MANRTITPGPDEAERRKYCARGDITLNGAKARITGWRDPQFGHVTQHGTGLGAEWSWAAIARVCQRSGGAFKS